MKKKMLALLLASILVFSGVFKRENSDEDNSAKIVRLSTVKGEFVCSGEQIKAPSKKNYILSAAHCRVGVSKSGEILVTTEDGKTMKRKFIAEDPTSDLMLLEGIPDMEGFKIAKNWKRGQAVKTFTHGGNYDTYRTDGSIIQLALVEWPLFPIMSQEDADKCSMPKYKIKDYEMFFAAIPACFISMQEFVSTAHISPGSSGGALLNDKDELIGVASATNQDYHYFVSLTDIQKFLASY